MQTSMNVLHFPAIEMLHVTIVWEVLSVLVMGLTKEMALIVYCFVKMDTT